MTAFSESAGCSVTTVGVAQVLLDALRVGELISVDGSTRDGGGCVLVISWKLTYFFNTTNDKFFKSIIEFCQCSINFLDV